MKYLKIYEDFNDYIYLDSIDKKSPEGYKFQIGDYVKLNDRPIPKAWYREPSGKWKEPKFNSSSICIICVVNKNINPNSAIDRMRLPYSIVPIKAPNSSYEVWVPENWIRLASDAEVAEEKYNL